MKIASSIFYAGLFFSVFTLPVLGQGSFVTTNPPSFPAQNAAQLNGFSDPRGNLGQTTQWFEWGPTILLGYSTQPIVSYGNVAASFSKTIVLPNPDATYFYRAVAQNSEGITYGIILTFKAPRYTQIPLFTTKEAPAVSSQLQAESAPIPQANIFAGKTVSNLSFENGTKYAITAKAGDTIGFTLTITNNSKKTLKNIIVKDALSPFFEFIDASDKGIFNRQEKEIRWKIEKLNPQESKILNFKTRTKNFEENIVISNYATIESGAETSGTNSVTIFLNILPISFSIKSDSKELYEDSIAQYFLNYKNESQNELKDVSLKIILPEGVEFKGSEQNFKQKGNMLVLNIGDLKPREEGFANFQILTAKEIKNKEEIVITAFLSYKDAFYNPQEDAVSKFASVFYEKPSELTAGILPETNLKPNFLNLVVLSIFILIAGFLAWYLRRKIAEKDKEIEILRDKIALMTRKTITG